MRGGSPAAADGMHSVLDGNPPEFPLHGVAAGKINQIIIRIPKIQRGGHEPFQPYRVLPPVDQPYRSGYDILLLKYGVGQPRLHPAYRIRQTNLQRFHPFSGYPPESRHPADGTGPFFDFVPVYLAAERRSPFSPDKLHAGRAVIAAAYRGKLLGQEIEGIGPVVSCLVGVRGKASVAIGEKVVQILVGNPAPIIQVKQMSVSADLHDIGAALCLQ